MGPQRVYLQALRYLTQFLRLLRHLFRKNRIQRSSNNDRSVQSDANTSETGSVRSYTGEQESTTKSNLKRKLQESEHRINKLDEQTEQLKHVNRDLSFDATNNQLIDAIDSSVTPTYKYSTLKFPGQTTEQASEFAAVWVEQHGNTFAAVTLQTLESGKRKYVWRIKEETKFKKVTVRKCVDANVNGTNKT